MSGLDFFLKYENDQRDQKTIQQQGQAVNYFADRNMKAFDPYLKQQISKMNLDKLSEKKKPKINIKKVEFEDGRYIEYREIDNEGKGYELPNKTIIFVAGVPGGINYFNKIEKSLGTSFCRVINLYLPGFDRKDERRGTYQGSLDQLIQLIEDFMKKINLEKAIFALHSFGGLAVKSFAYEKPHRVEALIQIASIPITKWQGYKLYEQIEKQVYQLDFEQIKFEMLQQEELRSKLSETINTFQKQLQDLPKDQQKQFAVLMTLSMYDVISMLKIRISLPGKLNELLHRMRQISKKIPRMIAYSPKDDLISPQLVEEEIYEFIVGENATQYQILEQVNELPQLDKNNFCSNYIFRFDDASHMVQQEKGLELGILMKHFIKQLDKTQVINNQTKI
ncbi:alpha/beta hydrolase family protein (macronuclear) [Tetrahymena thermophila SB210]|uniref:Alpha/beta hydrolase family protein n=1 Tax=Tetrahymena thermophila (strain SB210) TaxID=312017 RepID=Q24FE7_TETTS|nr:alpha/beta hydrolase family protein [Tetrahymena thermophila SB210]EAS06511.2 alpha/beta hydrolase family protein [Tetrahymena thermophila SB210]|eukprot:XP_001026756.2 alpha/beta hydrolase family protein [Tetrahymena thermophila SB210]